MKLIPESANVKDYLKELDVVDYRHPLIYQKIGEIFENQSSEIEIVRTAFLLVRDEISHSWDIQSSNITCKASEVLTEREGICYAKSNLLAALLRGAGIPTGFCYQRLMLFHTPEEGYCLHALNGVYLSSLNRWIRLDARGNKPGVQAEFSVNEEKLAFSINEKLGEKDYPIIYTEPNKNTMATLNAHTNALEMYMHRLPDDL
ncbi:transglutaminase [Lysinibacillus sp. B2A1]|nr:transglutaminase [Lysinibacillus sp. B2A1]